MTLARSLPDSAAEWWIITGVVALYALCRWFLAWRQARRDGEPHAARAALAEEDDPVATQATILGGFPSYRQFFGFVGSALVVGLVAGLTDGTSRVVLLSTVVPVLVAALAYLDFRQARKAREERRAGRGTVAVSGRLD
ncbi:hypothetical protein [Streptomyces sp. NPDC090994]|uniref:hypothetical protein n=1 Tax=Streptomyces sp. NPDC090994 TaxID=3365969 RepID=UPI00380A260A